VRSKVEVQGLRYNVAPISGFHLATAHYPR
jgi:hypothetical protein